MKRTAVASVAGLAVVGTLVVPAILPTSTLPTAFAALSPPTAVPPRLVFTGVTGAGSPDSAADVYDVLAADGDDQRLRVDSAEDGSLGFDSPSYSPDGTRAVFTRQTDDDDGAGRRLVTAVLTGPGEATPEPLASGWTPGTWDAEPDWSTDDRIAFTRAVDDPGSEERRHLLRVLDLDSGGVTDPLAALGINQQETFDGLVTAPAWSPDGSRIAFTVATSDEDEFGSLWVLDLDDGVLLRAVAADGTQVRAHGPAWSPDGTRLAYPDPDVDGEPLVAATLGEPDLTAGTVPAPAELLYTTASDDPRVGLWAIRHPAWSPDGSEIVVVAEDWDGGDGAPLGIHAISLTDRTYRTISDAAPDGTPWTSLSGPDHQPWGDLATSLEASASDVETGDLLELTTTVTNAGPSPAWGVTVELELPGAWEGLDVVVGAPPGCEGQDVLTCTVAEPLGPGESVELTVTVVIEDAGDYTVDARATATTPDPEPQDNVAALDLVVDLPPALGIEPRLAFSYSHGFKGQQVDLADVLAADASDLRILVDDTVVHEGRSTEPWEESPSYSPDGRRVVLTADRRVGGSNGTSQLLWARALMVGDVGPGPGRATDVTLLDYQREDYDDDADPVWSPTGERIAFLRRPGGDGYVQLALVPTDVAAAPVTILAPDAWGEDVDVRGVAWAPDGQRLVVSITTGFSENPPTLWVVEEDAAYRVVEETEGCGTAPSCLTPVQGDRPAWSPDGSTLAFRTDYTAGQWNVEGIATVPLTAPRVTSTGELAYVVPAPLLVAGADPDHAGDAAPEGYLHLDNPTWALDSGSLTFDGMTSEYRGALLSVPAAGGPTTVLRDFPRPGTGARDPVYQPWVDVEVELSAGPPVAAGRPVPLTATVTNRGPSPAWDTAAVLTIPAVAAGEATVESWPPGCTPSDTGLTCTLAQALPVDTPVELDVTLRLTVPGSHPVQAAVTTASVDPEPGNDAAVLTLEALVPPLREVEPQLAFTRQAALGDVSRDIADVPQAGGPYDLARLLAHRSVTTTDGRVLHLDEEQPDYSPDGTTLVFSAHEVLDEGTEPSLSVDQRLTVGTIVPGAVPAGEPALTDIRPLAYATAERFSDLEPVWSPDGRTIAFTRQDSFYQMAPAIHLLDVDSGQVREVVLPENLGFEARSPAWAPDGQRLVVQVTALNEDTEVWVVHLDPAGDTWYPVGTVDGQCSGPPQECFVAREGWAPAWSPDGSQLAVGDGRLSDAGIDGYSAIEVWDLPGRPGAAGYEINDTRVLVGTPRLHDGDLPPGQLEAAWHPAWSPDGTEISFVGRPPGQPYDTLYRIPATGSVPIVRLAEWTANNPGRYADPAYQPWADVALELTVPPQVDVGDQLQVRVLVRNEGPSAAWGVEVVLALPAAATVTAAVPGCAPPAAGTVTCTVPDRLAAGATTGIVMPVRLGTAGSHTFTGELSTTTLDTVPANNVATATGTALEPLPDADGVEPRLAFTYRHPGGSDGEATDVADVFWADGEQFRVIADGRLTDPTGVEHRPVEDHPSYSPDGRRLVLSSVRDLVANEEPGRPYRPGDEAVLTIGTTRPGPTGLVDVEPLDYDRAEGAGDTQPAWSPDGTRIAFVRHLPGSAGDELALVELATGAVRYVPGLPAVVRDPSWSPDGERIVVDAGEGGLWVVHVADDEVFPVVVDQPACDPDVSTCAGTAHAPAWSPDGTQVAFVDRYPTAGGTDVDGLFTVTMPAAPQSGSYRAGTARRLVGPDPADADPPGPFADLDSPAWSLDGLSVAFVGRAHTEDAVDAIATVPAAGGTPRVLRDEVRAGVRHGFGDLDHQPWADLGLTVTAAAPQVEVGTAVDVTVTVTNHGPSPAWGTAVQVDLPAGDLGGPLPAGCAAAGGQVTCSGAQALPVAATESFTFTLRSDTPGSIEVAAAVTSRMIDPVSGNDVDAAAVDVVPRTPPPVGPTPTPPVDVAPTPPPTVDLLVDVAVSLHLGQPTGWVGGDPVPATVVVTNEGTGPAGTVLLTLTHPEAVDPAEPCLATAPCDLGTLAAGASRTVVLDLQPVATGTGPVTATVTTTARDVDPRNNTATDTLEVLQPVLRLLPSVTTPGEPTLAYGVDFPPGAQLTLTWSRGITAWIRPVTVREDGTVRAPLLVLPGDELGERVATATSADGPAFGDVAAPPMLVVPRTFSPPNFLTRG